MLTLGVETSCDETSCAVLVGRHKILSNVVSSSLFRHQPFGGVVPEIASRHCLEQIDFVFAQALKAARVKAGDLGLVAVTEGPGLIGSLLVGVAFAKALAYDLEIPLVGVNHLEAHLAANFIGADEPSSYIGLIVSGGHTSLTHHEHGKVTLLGETVDDAAGEAFDKTAKILGLGYPGGPVIEKLAREGNPAAVPFTKPKQKNRFDFSFSGIKTAVLYLVRGHKGNGCLPKRFKADLCASFQKAVVSWLVEKSVEACRYTKARDIVVGGGVSANSYFRQKLAEAGAPEGVKVWFPPLSLTSDNAAMIARRGLDLYEICRERFETVPYSFDLTGNPNLRIA